MKRIKKDAWMALTSKRPGLGLTPKTYRKIIITVFDEKSSPNLARGGGVPPMAWELFLAVTGAGWLTAALFRLIDWIER